MARDIDAAIKRAEERIARNAERMSVWCTEDALLAVALAKGLRLTKERDEHDESCTLCLDAIRENSWANRCDTGSEIAGKTLVERDALLDQFCEAVGDA